jgi:hypothetical protein
MSTEHTDGGLWLTITELAEQKGVGKSTISEKVKRLVDAGKIETRAGDGGTKLVNLAQYDKAVGETTDPAKELGAETRDETVEPVGDSRYRDAKTRQAQYAADLQEIALKEKLGELVPVEEVRRASARIVETILRVVDRLPARAEEITSAVSKEGAIGARGKLKEMARDLRSAIAESLAALGKTGQVPGDAPTPGDV